MVPEAEVSFPATESAACLAEKPVPAVSVATVEPMTDIELTPTLLGGEHIGPKGWIRQFLCFELADDYDIDYVSNLLHTAYKAMKKRTPIAGCKLVPLQLEKGTWQLVPYADDEIDDFVTKDLRDTDFVSFAEFKARDYPVSVLTLDTAVMRPEWPGPEDLKRGFNTTWMQANFIKGGLLLNVLVFHSQADATSSYVFARILSEEIRKAQGLEVQDAMHMQALMEGRSRVGANNDMVKSARGKIEDHPEYVVLPFAPQGPPPKLTNPIHHAHVFHFSPDALARMKKDAWPAEENLNLLKGKHENEALPEYISSNDAINALLWKVVMDVQHPNLKPHEPSKPSVLSLALDLRRRAGIHKYTLGNLLGWAPLFLDVKSVIHEATLADLATMIRRALEARSDAAFVNSIENMLRRLEADDISLGRVAPLVFLDLPGPNTLTSSWRDCPFYDIEWGSALGGRIKAVRMPSVGVCHGFQITLPDRPDKEGIEMLVGVENEAMERLLSHPLWNKYISKPMGL